MVLIRFKSLFTHVVHDLSVTSAVTRAMSFFSTVHLLPRKQEGEAAVCEDSMKTLIWFCELPKSPDQLQELPSSAEMHTINIPVRMIKASREMRIETLFMEI